MGPNSTQKVKGVLGAIHLGSTNLTSHNWILRPYLVGELLALYTESGSKNVTWSDDYKSGGPVTWYQTRFSKPIVPKNSSLLLSGIGLNRGHYYLNGNDLGRYWLILRNDGSNTPTQTYYYIPQDYLLDNNNVLTISAILPVEDITKIDFVTAQLVESTDIISDSGIQVCDI